MSTEMVSVPLWLRLVAVTAVAAAALLIMLGGGRK